MNTLSNNTGIGMAMAVWLAHDDYDSGASEHEGKNLISATGLLKAVRQTVLSYRVPPQDRTADVTDKIASRLGHAIHDSVERTWANSYRPAMKLLGYPKRMIDMVRINPADHELGPDIMPVYLEQRGFRSVTVDGVEFVISGKFDQILDGEVNDIKSTSVYTYIKGSKELDYQLQGSIYRWINPDKITKDTMRIQHVFTDWQRAMIKTEGYPQQRVVELVVPLLSLHETELWIKTRIRALLANQDLEEPEIVRCTPDELWMSPPQFKYYSDPKKAAEGGRSTKNFPNYPAAAAFANKAGKGIVITVDSEPKACRYCPAFDICSQKDEYPSNQVPEEETTNA